MRPDELDVCGGQADEFGWYSYGNTAGCLQEQAMVASGLSFSDHSPQLGWSYVSLVPRPTDCSL